MAGTGQIIIIIIIIIINRPVDKCRKKIQNSLSAPRREKMKMKRISRTGTCE